MIKGLTLIRPWPWAILSAGKRIENRSWAPGPQLHIGDLIAIHAGVKWDQDDARWIERSFNVVVPAKDRHPSGVIVGIARYGGLTGNTSDPWFVGPCGWILEDVKRITPIAHRGGLGLWTLTSAAMQALRAQGVNV